jgi:hypothetical protein
MHGISPFPVFFVFKLFAFLAFVEEERDVVEPGRCLFITAPG